jgi:hypothetical protein
MGKSYVYMWLQWWHAWLNTVWQLILYLPESGVVASWLSFVGLSASSKLSDEAKFNLQVREGKQRWNRMNVTFATGFSHILYIVSLLCANSLLKNGCLSFQVKAQFHHCSSCLTNCLWLILSDVEQVTNNMLTLAPSTSHSWQPRCPSTNAYKGSANLTVWS